MDILWMSIFLKVETCGTRLCKNYVNRLDKSYSLCLKQPSMENTNKQLLYFIEIKLHNSTKDILTFKGELCAMCESCVMCYVRVLASSEASTTFMSFIRSPEISLWQQMY